MITTKDALAPKDVAPKKSLDPKVFLLVALLALTNPPETYAQTPVPGDARKNAQNGNVPWEQLVCTTAMAVAAGLSVPSILLARALRQDRNLKTTEYPAIETPPPAYNGPSEEFLERNPLWGLILAAEASDNFNGVRLRIEMFELQKQVLSGDFTKEFVYDYFEKVAHGRFNLGFSERILLARQRQKK